MARNEQNALAAQEMRDRITSFADDILPHDGGGITSPPPGGETGEDESCVCELRYHLEGTLYCQRDLVGKIVGYNFFGKETEIAACEPREHQDSRIPNPSEDLFSRA